MKIVYFIIGFLVGYFVISIHYLNKIEIGISDGCNRFYLEEIVYGDGSNNFFWMNKIKK